MRIVRPGDTYRDGFGVQGGTGASAAADSLPAGAVYRNGTLDAAVTVTVASVATGAYTVSCTVPLTYAPGDTVQVLATGVIGGLTVRNWGAAFTVAGYPATALPNAAAGAAGGVPLGDASGEVTLADGVTHGGSAALLRLGSSTVVPALHVTNSAGHAVFFQAAGGDSHGLRLLGAGEGSGLYAEGGTTGDGATFYGGDTGGYGLLCEAFGFDYNGLSCVGAAAGAGLWAEGKGGAAGIHAAAEGPGAGLDATLSPATLASFFTTDSGSAGAAAAAGSVVAEVVEATAAVLAGEHGAGSWEGAPGVVDANVTSVAGVAVGGAGTEEEPWGPLP